MSKNRRFDALRTLRLAVLAAVVALPGVALAQSRPPEPPGAPHVAAPLAASVSVDVMCVRATKANDRVDPELKELLKPLSFTGFTGFDLISHNTDALSAGEEASFAIEGGRRLKVQLIDRDEVQARLRLRLFGTDGTKQLDTTVAVHRNRIFMVAGPKVGEDVLIIPVMAKY